MEDQVIDYRKKYEKLVRETLKEIEGTVKKAQRRAEETSRGIMCEGAFLKL